MSTISLDAVSRWYGNVVAVNGITMTVGPGVTGLLGPNGAGKTTLIALMAGFLSPSAGTVTLDGAPIWRNTEVYRTIGLVPEREISFGYLTGRQFVLANAELHGLPDPGAAAERALRDRRDGRAGRAADRHLLQGHAAAGQARLGARARPRRAAARRAVQRRRPAPAPAPDGAAPAVRRRGPHRPVQLPHPRGGRAGRPPDRGGRLGAARRVRRLRRDPAADDRPAGPVRRGQRRRPPAGQRADRRAVRGGGRPAPAGRRRAGSTCRCPTSASSPCGCPGCPATPAYACSSWPRPTSRSRASSPTWWGGERR